MPKEINDSDAIRRLMDSQLLNRPPDCVHNFFNDITNKCQANGIQFDLAAALEYWWHLARLGVVALPGGTLHSLYGVGRHREVVVTDRGKKLLQKQEQSPHDPEKYIVAVKQRVPDLDPVALTYLDEAVGAWGAGLYRSSAVMLGCACEKLVLLLAETTARAGGSKADKVRKLSASVPIKISALFTAVRSCLSALDGTQKLPGHLRDALDRKLSAVFDHARGLRNQSGHPTEADVSYEDAEAGLLLFPGFCVFIYDLIGHLEGRPTAKTDES